MFLWEEAHEPELLSWGVSRTEAGLLRWRWPEAHHLRAASWPSSGAGSSNVSLLIGHSLHFSELGIPDTLAKQAPCLCSHLLPPWIPRGAVHISLEAEVTFSSSVHRPCCLSAIAAYPGEGSLRLKCRLIVHQKHPSSSARFSANHPENRERGTALLFARSLFRPPPSFRLLLLTSKRRFWLTLVQLGHCPRVPLHSV